MQRVPPRIDAELARAAACQPDLDYSDVPGARRGLARALKLARAFQTPEIGGQGLRVTDRDLPTRDGDHRLAARFYEPHQARSPSPALVFFHGGAFVAGDLETEHLRCVTLARRSGVIVMSVDYRLAPEHPFPAALHDCYDALLWLHANAPAIGVDPARLAVGGSSAGGALAAAVALMARDCHGPSLTLQLLLYPVMDDRMETPSMRAFDDTPGWNAINSVHMWRHYLGALAAGSEAVPAYAAPGRATDLAGLPPAYVLTAEFDPLRDEGIDYAGRLLQAGVPTELHQFPGAFHGFDVGVPQAGLSVLALDEQSSVLARALGAAPEDEGPSRVSREVSPEPARD